MKVKSFTSIIIFVLLFHVSLKSTGQDTVNRYIFMGHCYQYGSGGKKVDHRIESLDLSKYAGIWLGGDVCAEAMLEYSTIQYIDSLFDLGNPETHWSLGNHDARNGNWEWYEEFTDRDTYYAYSKNGITRVIMNTNLVPTDCENMDAQFEMIINACDTVKTGNHLILIMHHGIWDDIPGLPSPFDYAQSNLIYWNSNCYSVTSTFSKIIYPELVEAHSRGVHVYCILGDMGDTQKSIDFISDDGILFLGCGLYKNEPEDRVLIFSHQTITNQLTYQYHKLDSLLMTQRK